MAPFPHRIAPYLILVLGILISGCGESNPKPTKGDKKRSEPVLGRINWIESADHSKPALLTNRQFKTLLSQNLIGMDTISPNVARIDITGTLEIVDGGGSLFLTMRMHLVDHMSPFETGIVAFGSASKPTEGTALVRKAAGDLSHALLKLSSLVDGTNAKLTAALNAAEVDEQTLALKILGHKKVVSSIDAIGPLLEDPRQPVRESAAEALARIGDRKAVPLLIRAIKRYDLRSEVRAIEAMGRIGGPEAKAYLEMTAGGHEIEEVRRLSKTLLQGMPK